MQQIDLGLPELKDLVLDATRALSELDVNRLQELALSCEALTKMPLSITTRNSEERARRARAVKSDMDVFARVLEATRANVKVMERLRELRTGKRTYSGRVLDLPSSGPTDPERDDGNN